MASTLHFYREFMNLAPGDVVQQVHVNFIFGLLREADCLTGERTLQIFTLNGPVDTLQSAATSAEV